MRSFACFVTIDLLSILLGFGVAIVVRSWFLGDTYWQSLLLFLLPVYLLLAFNNHSFSSDNLLRPLRASGRGIRTLALAVGATVLLGFSLKTTETFPRLVTASGFAMSCLAMFAGRYWFARNFSRIIGGNPFQIFAIRHGDQPTRSLPGSIALDIPAQFDPEAVDPESYDQLARTIGGADRVIVACDIHRRLAWAHLLKGLSVRGEIIVPELAPLTPLNVATFDEQPTIIVSVGRLGFVDSLLKRLLDLVLGSMMVIILFPLISITALAIKLDSRGPVFFRQRRIGQDNRTFSMLKFRSMRVEAQDGDGMQSTQRDDERITRIGRVIRATSIDELPQLFNVLAGDMSLVGPRPHALGSRAANKLFWEIDGRYWHRHAVKPGMTGLAQVRGFRGATLLEADLTNRLSADLEYLENWTIWRDLQIVALTCGVLVHRNAY